MLCYDTVHTCPHGVFFCQHHAKKGDAAHGNERP